MSKTSRKALFAGSWYQGQPTRLHSSIVQALSAVENATLNQRRSVRFAVVPHAGHYFSARALAQMVAHSPKVVEKVLILAPSHYQHLADNQLTVGSFDSYETPLGNLSGFELLTTAETKGHENRVAIQQEHAVEMLLPFLAFMQERQQKPLAVTVVLINRITSRSACEELGTTIERSFDVSNERHMVLSSSDFTHYGPRFNYTPYREQIAKRVKEHDLNLAQQLINGDIDEALSFRGTVCGLAGATLVAYLAKRLENQGEVADYYTSLDILESDEANFVTYCTLFWR